MTSEPHTNTPGTVLVQGPAVDLDNVTVVRIEPSRKWVTPKLGELWEYRELLYFFVWRDIKVRYKQTAIGAGWAVFQPLITMIIFAVVFRTFANVPSDGLPYSVFSYAGLLSWTLFASALTRSITSLVGQSHLISKVYFPRLIVPIAATISGIVDFAIAFLILVGMMIWYGIVPAWPLLSLPFFIAMTLAAALAIGLWLSALNVKYRDVAYSTPLLISLWMFLSPIAYPISQVPDHWRSLYNLNPMTGVVTGFRWALLGSDVPDPVSLAMSTVVIIAVFIGGIFYFKRMEQTFADIV